MHRLVLNFQETKGLSEGNCIRILIYDRYRFFMKHPTASRRWVNWRSIRVQCWFVNPPSLSPIDPRLSLSGNGRAMSVLPRSSRWLSCFDIDTWFLLRLSVRGQSPRILSLIISINNRLIAVSFLSLFSLFFFWYSKARAKDRFCKRNFYVDNDETTNKLDVAACLK